MPEKGERSRFPRHFQPLKRAVPISPWADLGIRVAAALSLVYNLIIIIVCWVFYTVMTNAGSDRQASKGVA